MTKEIHATDAAQCIVWRWPNFPPSEIGCNHCGMLLNDPAAFDALDRLQAFRNAVKVPVIVNSAYRCAVHNKNDGGAKNSQHRNGRAFDIRITPTLSRDTIHRVAKQVGFTGFGNYDTFVHVDTGPARSWDERTKK